MFKEGRVRAGYGTYYRLGEAAHGGAALQGRGYVVWDGCELVLCALLALEVVTQTSHSSLVCIDRHNSTRYGLLLFLPLQGVTGCGRTVQSSGYGTYYRLEVVEGVLLSG